MHEPFFISLNHEGVEHEFKARFERYGYTHRITVLIGETVVIFEPDKEGSYRALGSIEMGSIQPGLLQALSAKLSALAGSS